jgi:16S rRNA (guanine966-N2)-methyltransferase
MRIISGEHGGRKIHPPTKMPHTRPTTDIAKEGLFNILQNQLAFEDLKTLDLFGGTGNISYELASRGVRSLTVVEKDSAMFDFIRKTAANLKLENVNVIRMDVFRFLDQCAERFDLIFAGPPYALNRIDDIPTIIFERRLLQENGWFILEHTPRNDYKKFPFYKMERNYGTTVFSFFVENRSNPSREAS